MTKTIKFSTPENCPFEFKRVYYLIQGMQQFAQHPPELKDIFKYGEMGYIGHANAEISRIKDLKYLDTLLYLLPKETKYEEAIIRALQNIGDKKAIPVIKRFLDQLELREYSYGRAVIMAFTLEVLALLEGKESIRIVKNYLDKKYEPWVRFKAGMILIKLNDYSTVPDLISFLKESNFNGFVDGALWQIQWNKRVISAIIKALKEEVNEKELDDKRINGLIHGLSVITVQADYYPYKLSDSLEVKRKSITKWFDWWEENKDKIK